MKEKLIILLTISLLSSCALNNQDADVRFNTGRQARFFGKSGLASCIGAGVLGAGLGYLIGKNSSDSGNGGTGAGIGAVGACVAAMSVNYYLETQRVNYANNEERLEAEIAQINESNAALQETIKATKQVLKDNRKTLNNLNKQIAAKNVNKAQAQKDLDKIDSNIKTLKDRNNQIGKVIDNHSASAQYLKSNGVNTRTYENKIKQLKREKQELENYIGDLSNQRNAIKLG